MTRARVLLIVTAALFVGWLGWLGYAVSQRGRSPVVSRAQLTAATHLVVAEVTVGEDDLPATAKVTEVIRGEGVQPGLVQVMNLSAAMPPGAARFPGSGTYLLPLVGDGTTFRVAGLPRSPGYDPPNPPRPVVYRWDDDTRAQLKGLGVLP